MVEKKQHKRTQEIRKQETLIDTGKLERIMTRLLTIIFKEENLNDLEGLLVVNELQRAISDIAIKEARQKFLEHNSQTKLNVGKSHNNLPTLYKNMVG